MLARLGRLAGTLFGLAAIVVAILITREKMAADPKRTAVTESLEATSSLRQELGRDAHVSVTPVSGEVDDDAMDVKVVYPASTPQAERIGLQASTNIIIRRYVHHVRDVKIAFGDTRSEELAPLPPGNPDGGIAVPAAPWVLPEPTPAKTQTAAEPAVKNGPATQPGKKTAPVAKKAAPTPGTGTLTLVTFPESQVYRGNQQLGKTPLFNVELPVGTHLLTLVGADGTRHALSAQVRPGKNPPMKVNLGDVPER